MTRLALALLVAASLFTAPRAQAGRPNPAPVPLYIPWTIAAEDDGVESVLGHHAGLGFLNGVEFGFSFALPTSGEEERSTQFSWMLGGSLGPLALGIGYSLFPSSAGIDALTHRVDIGTAVRLSHGWTLAFGWHGFYSNVDAQLDQYESWSISTTLRPLRWLALGVGFDRINTPRYGADVIPAIGKFSVAFRPNTERFSFGIDATADIDEPAGWSVGGSLRAMPVDGFVIGAYGRYARGGYDAMLQARPDTDVVQWGAYIGLSQSAVEVQTGVDGTQVLDGPGASRTTFNTLIKAGTNRRTSLVTPKKRIVGLRIAGAIPERVTTGLLGGLLTPSRGTPFAYWLAAFDIVARDPDVSGLMLRLDAAPSWAQCWELREAIDRIRKAGKSVFVYFANGDMKTLYLASAADKTFMHPAGTIMAQGLAITRSYYGDMLKHLGVNAQFIKYAEYKSAPEAFTGTGPSDPAKQQTRELLAAFERQWNAAVGKGRNKSVEELTKVLKDGPLTAELAKKHGMVDAIVADEALGQALKDALGHPASLVRRYRPSPSAWARWSAARKVAIVPVTGSIVDGYSSEALPIDLPFIGGDTTGDRSFIPALMAAARDPSVLGIVVRVNSGGGAVLASDKMYRAIQKAAKAKPLVVSFGNVAASGGYYLAAGAPRITATPPTITGSIGIFAGKVDLSELYRKVGISTHTERTLPAADAMGMHRPFTEAELERAMTRLKSYYDMFVGVVASGRKLNKQAAFERAKGRVYDGDKALELKLVDAHAGLWDAIQWVRAKAGATGDPFTISYLPVDNSFLASLGRLFAGVFGGDADAVAEGGKREPSVLEQLGLALFRLKPATVYAQMPYVLEIK